MTLNPTVVRQAGPNDAEALTQILATSFREDPPLQWILTDPADLDRLSPAFFRPFVDLVLADGLAHVSDDLSGAVLWLDVDVNAGEDPGAADFRQLFVDGLGQKYAERFFVLDEMFSAGHPGHESHAYLLFAGVVPDRQGQGLGRTLIEHRLAELDSSRTPAYLEASCARNMNLYARLGFEPTGTPVVLPEGPTLYPMWRPAAA